MQLCINLCAIISKKEKKTQRKYKSSFKIQAIKCSVKLVEMYESHKMWVSFGTVKVWEDFVNKKNESSDI